MPSRVIFTISLAALFTYFVSTAPSVTASRHCSSYSVEKLPIVLDQLSNCVVSLGFFGNFEFVPYPKNAVQLARYKLSTGYVNLSDPQILQHVVHHNINRKLNKFFGHECLVHAVIIHPSNNEEYSDMMQTRRRYDNPLVLYSKDGKRWKIGDRFLKVAVIKIPLPQSYLLHNYVIQIMSHNGNKYDAVFCKYEKCLITGFYSPRFTVVRVVLKWLRGKGKDGRDVFELDLDTVLFNSPWKKGKTRALSIFKSKLAGLLQTLRGVEQKRANDIKLIPSSSTNEFEMLHRNFSFREFHQGTRSFKPEDALEIAMTFVMNKNLSRVFVKWDNYYVGVVKNYDDAAEKDLVMVGMNRWNFVSCSSLSEGRMDFLAYLRPFDAIVWISILLMVTPVTG